MRHSKALTVAMHVVGWLLLLGLLVSFVSFRHPQQEVTVTDFFHPPLLLFLGCWMVVFYANKLVLVPQLYLRKKYLAYFGIFVALLVAVYLLRPFDALIVRPSNIRPDFRPDFRPGSPLPPDMPRRGPRPPRGGPHLDITSIIMFIMMWSLSFVIEITKIWRRTEQRAAQAETEKARAELNVLKAQINPHFLFNTLNNIYAMAVTGNEATAPSIMKLSQIMRYLTETAQQDNVPLESAVGCISDYIDLHRVRLNKQTSIDYTVTGNLQGLHISPLLLLPFVENIFKYGISSHEPSPITIRLEVQNGNLRFYCRNRIFTQNRPAESTGIGIDNTRKRMAFLYPDRHRLHISSDDGWFTVELEIQL